MFIMNKLPLHKQELIVRCLVEGMSIRSTARTAADVSKNTVLKLLKHAGAVCSAYQDSQLRELQCRRVEVDEIWSFVYSKQKNVSHAKNPPKAAGDAWTWVAMDPDSKLVVSWLVGDRTGDTALEFMSDLRSRVRGHMQLSSDGHKPYIEAVEKTFAGTADFGVDGKIYGTTPEDARRRYLRSDKLDISGRPKEEWISTSGIERCNLTMRMCMRRFTGKTNAFSKKVENHAAAISLHFMYYNFCRIHQSLRITPAMEAGVTERVMEISDIVRMVNEELMTPGPRGAYRKRSATISRGED